MPADIVDWAWGLLRKSRRSDGAVQEAGIDPEETFTVCRCNVCFQEKRTLLSLRVTGEFGHDPSFTRHPPTCSYMRIADHSPTGWFVRQHIAVASLHGHQVDTEDTCQTLRNVFRLGV